MPEGITNSTYEMMTIAGWSFIAISIALVVIPYLRKRADLVTAWNCVLAACVISLGAGCLEAVDRPDRVFEDYISFDFPDADYKESVIRLVVFFVALLFFYYKVPFFKRFAQRRFISTPADSGLLMAWVIGLGAVIVVASLVVTTPFFSQLLLNLSHKAAVFMATFVFVAWYKNKVSLPTLALFVTVFASALVFSMVSSTGRRLLLTVCAVPMFSMYWLAWRYRSRTRVLVSLAVLGGAVVVAGLGYQEMRRFNQKRGGDERTAANVIKHLGNISPEGMLNQLKRWKTTFGQGCFDYGLIVKRLVDKGELEEQPLNSIQFLATYPIPRRYWENKPEPIGASIVISILNLPFKTTWGIGMHGHSYYEGGYWSIIIYAALMVMLVRLLDEPLKREPNNPFFIAALVAAFAFLVNMARGDYGGHVAEVVECFLYNIILIMSSSLFTTVQPMAYAPRQYVSMPRVHQ